MSEYSDEPVVTTDLRRHVLMGLSLARHADYVLPAASQFEKREATFFNVEFPVDTFQLRPPVFGSGPGALPKPEIYARLLRRLDAADPDLIDTLNELTSLRHRDWLAGIPWHKQVPVRLERIPS